MIKKSTIQLLRFPFSYFLMPVFWFSLSFIQHINWINALIIFLILHLLVYPSSNGYNSYMDRDVESIGGLEKPMMPTRQLYFVTVFLDVAAILASLLVSTWFSVAVLLYIVCSRLYSYRGIRLKQYPITGYLIVIINQGALTFFMVYHGAGNIATMEIPWEGVVTAAFLIGGFYPITQVYQHSSDAKDGVETISMLLGKRGTFIFCAGMYSIALGILFYYYMYSKQITSFLVLQIFFIPILVFFVRWFLKVWKDENQANFANTMQMNWMASTCTSMAFITLLILHQFG